MSSIQDRPPNFRVDGKLYLVRCFVCEATRGRENWAMAVSNGECAWCGYKDKHIPNEGEITSGNLTKNTESSS